ncbi:SET domain-containing protein [Polyporus arcularius HHB13444]|uniref:SET domain-containing protein n=1 Tax=Polyporus arcularius HHB13444 TaxID=1314778 RepID=A0A5C3PAS7_9APHY|nr:SET domain-containing protein [Polyporus arcularius HHB13444]
MRRCFFLSMSRGRGLRTTARTNSSVPKPPPASKPSLELDSKPRSSPLIGSSAEVIPIPTSRYTDPPALPNFPRGFEVHKFDIAAVPEDAPAELVTLFAYYNSMLEALRAQFPDWPQSFETPSPPIHKVCPIKGTGLGIVAVADIAAGETIVRERPYILLPLVLPAPFLGFVDGLEDAMHPENYADVYALKNSRRDKDPMEELRGIIVTNSLRAGPFPTYEATYGGLARDISRANHSCHPNAHHTFDAATLSHSLRALHSIRAGEEITISYLGCAPLLPYEERQKLFKNSRQSFKCTCKFCRLKETAREDSETRRRFILFGLRRTEFMEQLYELFEEWLAEGAPAMQSVPRTCVHGGGLFLNILEVVESMWSFMVQEEFYEPCSWEPILALLVKGHAVLENEERVQYFATKAAELRTAYTGSDGGWRAVAANPRQTHWWGKLGEKRKM